MGIGDEINENLESIEQIVLELVKAHGDDAVRLEEGKGFISACIIRDISANMGMAALDLLARGQIGSASIMLNMGNLMRTLADLAEGKDFKSNVSQVMDMLSDLGFDPEA